MNIEIDSQSGFCFGVVTAIRKAEEELRKCGTLYCLGDIVHNGQEVKRLSESGLVTINHEQFGELPRGSKVLIRAHGEPPATYETAKETGVEIIDASCPVVRSLQKRISDTYRQHKDGQIVIFGKQGHAEVIGLQGQTENRAIVVEGKDALQKIDFGRDIYLFSQTTKSVEEFERLVEQIKERVQAEGGGVSFEWHDTICGQVRNRVRHIKEFAASHDKIVFVGGRNSSNGKVLYQHCVSVNEDTIFIENAGELTEEYIKSCEGKDIGICGATSTPLWLMEEVRRYIIETTNS